MKKIIFLFFGITLFVEISLNNIKKESIYISDNIDNNEINNIAFYLQESEESTSYLMSKVIPGKADGYVFKEAVCKDANAVVNFDSNEWAIYVSNISDIVTKCSLYFDIDTAKARDYILADKTITTRSDYSSVLTTDTTGTIYSAEDDNGNSYYYAGASTDNWFYLNGYYWRIIRINGDGTIRMIYQGESSNATGSNTLIDTDVFNTLYADNMYEGYMYTSGSVHGIGTSSTIKEILDNWFSSNLTSYANYIDPNAGFCGDRTPYTYSNDSYIEGGGTGTSTTYYGAYVRLVTNKMPTLTCSQSSDLYTTSSSSVGNKGLTYPIGLITADEISLAGGVYSIENTNYYLYTGSAFWTMSPCYYNSSKGAREFIVDTVGALSNGAVNSTRGVRPVINIKKDVELTGTGTSKDPYRIVGTPEPVNNIAAQTILANKTISTRSDFSTPYTTTTTNTVFSAEDNDGTSYYYAGAATDNYVKFAGFYWRIIRINGDGTIRMIYDGIQEHYNGDNNGLAHIGSSGFNSDNKNMYVGFMYTSDEVHGLGTSSRAKNALDTWYSNNLTSYSDYIDNDAGFCNDRVPYICSDIYCSDATPGGGTGTTETYYAGYLRVSAKTPSLKCEDSADLFTLTSSNKGNKALTYPIGLITMDEVAYAGSAMNSGSGNTSYYLHIGLGYWTMTPAYNGAVYYVETISYMDNLATLSSDYYIRPVINLRADVTLTGSGTSSDPYVVS